MLIEMFVGDIGDDPDIKLTSIHPVLRPTMGGGLDHNMSELRSQHLCKIFLHIGRIWRGDMETSVKNFVPDDGVNCRNQPGFEPRSQQDLIYQVAGCSLPICASDANYGELSARVAVKSSCQPWKTLAGIFNLNIRNR